MALRLALRDVHLALGGRSVLAGVRLDLEVGELRVLVGSSGAGKTSLLRVVAGLLAPTEGAVHLDGHPASSAGRILIAPHRRGVGMAFQEDALWPHLTVRSHLTLGRRREPPNSDYPGVEEILEFVGLAGHAAERPGELSGGERQRLGIARALARRPRLLLLDEPLAHVDLRSRRELAGRLVAFAKRFAITTLWVTHQPEDLGLVGGRASLLSSGRLGGPFDASELRALLG